VLTPKPVDSEHVPEVQLSELELHMQTPTGDEENISEPTHVVVPRSEEQPAKGLVLLHFSAEVQHLSGFEVQESDDRPVVLLVLLLLQPGMRFPVKEHADFCSESDIEEKSKGSEEDEVDDVDDDVCPTATATRREATIWTSTAMVDNPWVNCWPGRTLFLEVFAFRS